MTAHRAFPEEAAALLLGLACAGAAVAGAAEEYPALAATEVAVFLAGTVALLRAFARGGTGGPFPTRDTLLAGCALGGLRLAGARCIAKATRWCSRQATRCSRLIGLV